MPLSFYHNKYFFITLTGSVYFILVDPSNPSFGIVKKRAKVTFTSALIIFTGYQLLFDINSSSWALVIFVSPGVSCSHLRKCSLISSVHCESIWPEL